MSKQAVVRIHMYHASKEMKDALVDAIADHLGQGSNYIRFSLEDRGFFHFYHDHFSYAINYQDIIYFEKQDRQIRLHSTKGDFLFYGTLSSLEKKLDPYQFFRVHQGFIVNVIKIRAYINSRLYLDPDNSYIQISKRREKNILELLNHFHYIQRIDCD